MVWKPGYQVHSSNVCSSIEHKRLDQIHERSQVLSVPELDNAESVEPDPAAVFACALSLWNALHQRQQQDRGMNLSECFNGLDGLMREVMKIGNLFESWACSHVDFDYLHEPWPYLLQDRFGEACTNLMLPIGSVAVDTFNERDCLRVAMQIALPIRFVSDLRIPLDVFAANPVAQSGYRDYRIQSVRASREDGGIAPFWFGDDPFDESFDPPHFGIYGVEKDGTLEHITDRATYSEAVAFLRKLVPGIILPEYPVAHIH